MNPQNSCYTYFRIIGTFDPDEVVKELGIEPSRKQRAGEKRKNGTVYEDSFCEFSRCDAYDILVENQMMQTIEPFLNKLAELRRIKERYSVEFWLEVVPSIFPGEPAPCLAPSKEVIKFCCATDTSIDIDLYVNEVKNDSFTVGKATE